MSICYTYLRVVCYVCGAAWNYCEEWPVYTAPGSTAVQIQGCVCPRCGSIGFIEKDVFELVGLPYRESWGRD